MLGMLGCQGPQHGTCRTRRRRGGQSHLPSLLLIVPTLDHVVPVSLPTISPTDGQPHVTKSNQIAPVDVEPPHPMSQYEQYKWVPPMGLDWPPCARRMHAHASKQQHPVRKEHQLAPRVAWHLHKMHKVARHRRCGWKDANLAVISGASSSGASTRRHHHRPSAVTRAPPDTSSPLPLPACLLRCAVLSPPLSPLPSPLPAVPCTLPQAPPPPAAAGPRHAAGRHRLRPAVLAPVSGAATVVLPAGLRGGVHVPHRRALWAGGWLGGWVGARGASGVRQSARAPHTHTRFLLGEPSLSEWRGESSCICVSLMANSPSRPHP